MRVISFHSYKGGRGRSTALASIANLLYRLGFNVVLLDADVTAPWLHTRYSVSADVLRRQGWLRGLMRELGAVERGVIPPVELGKYWHPIGSPASAGSIRLLSPGDPGSADYWEWVVAELPLITGLHPHPEVLTMWRDLRALITAASPPPDFLLVDAPAGYHQASALVALGLADAAVVFGIHDESDIAWTRVLATLFRESRKQVRAFGPLRVVSVLARYPSFHDAFRQAESEAGVQYSEALGGGLFDQFVVLPSDLHLETHQAMPPIPLSGVIEVTGLVEAYGQLLAATTPDQWPEAGALWDGLSASECKPGEHPKLFWLREHGVLANPADEEANVSFRVKTVCALLDDLHDELMSDVKGDGALEQQSDESHMSASTSSRAGAALRRSGRSTGERFGGSLAHRLDTMLSERELIERWCEFDSQVGFGRLELGALTLRDDGSVDVDIDVIGNFLAMDRNPDKTADLCPFMAGYIDGVLSALLGLPVSATDHRPADCMRVDSSRAGCLFEFRGARVPGD